MLKIACIALFGLVVTGCASVAPRSYTLASAKAVSSELECMVECLDDGTETCQNCADRCLRSEDGPQVASLK